MQKGTRQTRRILVLAPAPYAVTTVRVRGSEQAGADVGVEPILLERAVTLSDTEPDEVARALRELGAVPAVTEWAGDPSQPRTLARYYSFYRRLVTRRGTFGPDGSSVISRIAPGEYALLAVTHDGTILGYVGRVVVGEQQDGSRDLEWTRLCG